MSESTHPESGSVFSAKSQDSFGFWLQGDADGERPGQAGTPASPAAPPAPAGPAAPAEAGGADAASGGPDVASVRAFRAGRGPLASVIAALTPSGGAARAAAASAREAMQRGGFRPLEKPAAVAVVLLAGLVVAAGYAVRCDLGGLDGFLELQKQNRFIREHNHARSVLIQHLLKARGGRLARLKGYAQWMDQKQQQGVVVFTSQDGQSITQTIPPADEEQVELGDLRERVASDIEAIEKWTPPALLPGHDDLGFDTGELLISRLPVALGYACALVGLILWSTCAYRNLVVLQAPPTSFHWRKVPLLWIAPLANLFLPCAVMGEIWHGSDPGKLRNRGSLRLPVIGFWWPLVLTGLALVAVGVYRMTTAIGIDTMVDATRWALYADLGAILVGLITLALVAAGSWNQSRRYKLVAAWQQIRPAQA